MKKLSLIISMIFLMAATNCTYTAEKTQPSFPDFAKQTINFWEFKSDKPLTYKIKEENVPFAELQRRIEAKEMEPLICFPVSNYQDARRAWNKHNEAKK